MKESIFDQLTAFLQVFLNLTVRLFLIWLISISSPSIPYALSFNFHLFSVVQIDSEQLEKQTMHNQIDKTAYDSFIFIIKSHSIFIYFHTNFTFIQNAFLRYLFSWQFVKNCFQRTRVLQNEAVRRPLHVLKMFNMHFFVPILLYLQP